MVKQNENLLNEIKEYKKWENLDITSNDLKKISKLDILIGTISIKNFEKFTEQLNENIYYEIISENKKEINIIIFALKSENIKEVLRLFNFSNLVLDYTENIKENILKRENQIKENKNQILIFEENLKEYSKYIENIQIFYEYLKINY